MDPLRLCLALGPLAVYLLLLGAINLARRPFLVSGGRDLAALALALAGLAVVGPFELFLPEESIVVFGGYVWLMVLALYALWITMLILMLRPRLVIYNIAVDKLRPILADVVEKLDGDARWAGDSLVLPGLGVQLHLDSYRAMKNVSLKSIGGRQNFPGWKKLETALSAALVREEVPRNFRGSNLLLAGLLLAAVSIAAIVRNPQSLSQTLADLAEGMMQWIGR
ncbi:MAG: hypothetical protein IT426_11270 [Pirellulales bacterium]|nr:hypothetical protein [Pirellulales bacterium]